MKTRNDFVSNSSSCSFIVHDAKKTLELLNKLGDFPYQIDDFEVKIAYKHKYEKDIFKMFGRKEVERDRYYYNWDNRRIEIDPEAIECFYDASMYDLINLVIDKNPNIDKIEHIQFYCQNYNQLAVAVLHLLYKYFQKHGLKVNCEDTEIEFNDNTSFFSNLVNGLIETDKKV